MEQVEGGASVALFIGRGMEGRGKRGERREREACEGKCKR